MSFKFKAFFFSLLLSLTIGYAQFTFASSEKLNRCEIAFKDSYYKARATLWEVLELQKGAVLEKHPKIYHLGARYQQAIKLLPRHTEDETYYSNMHKFLLEIKDIHLELTNELTQLEQVRKVRNQVQFLSDAVTRIEELTQSFLHPENENISPKDHNKFYERVISSSSKIAEQVISYTLNGVVTTRTKINDLLKTKYTQAKSRAIELLNQSEKDSEIDIVFDKGRAWGEVKMLRNVVHTHLESWPGFYSQLKKMAAIKDALNKDLPPDQRVVELHLFLLSGASPEATKLIEELGFIIHQPQVAK